MDRTFFKRTGKMALGSRLRQLTDRITADASEIYKMYGVDIKPKWFPVYFLLAHGERMSVTEIAREIGQTHVSVSTIVKEMRKAGVITERKDRQDARRTVVMLTKRALQETERLELQCMDVAAAIDLLTAEAENDLWEAIGEIEKRLDGKSLLECVAEEKKRREQEAVQIVPYREEYHDDFVRLNKIWIETYWQLEEEDIISLEHTQEFILDKGGHIFVALLNGKPVGVCAMMRCERPEYDWEIAKYAVDPEARGNGIGEKLFRHILEKARETGGFRIFLESNTVLEAAVHIYRKFGFKELPDIKSEYERCNIQMELLL